MKKINYREILVAVTGLTPQVITETIYALSQKKIPIIIDEIRIITTSTGKKIIEDALFEKGILENLINEYNLKPLSINDDTFIVAKDKAGNEIADIINGSDNEVIGDLITSTIRSLSGDPAVRLHCSIAGGRKTMSFYLGAALQLFGRSQDRLYHVLVSPEFESNPNFYYKPKKNRAIEGRSSDGKPKKLNTSDAEIQLAELPFIRLTDKLPLRGKNFKELVEEGQKEIDTATIQPEVIVNLTERAIQVGNSIIEMLPIQLMFYTAFLRRKLFSCVHPEKSYCKSCSDCFLTIKNDLMTKQFIEQIAEDHRIIYKNSPMRTNDFLEKWKNGMTGEVIRQNISKVKKTINEQLEDDTLKPIYTITCVKQYPGSRYGVRVEKTRIRIEC